jgi:hypothetical protein
MRNGKGAVVRLLGGTCGHFGDSCGRSELPWRDADAPARPPGVSAAPGVCSYGDKKQNLTARLSFLAKSRRPTLLMKEW